MQRPFAAAPAVYYSVVLKKVTVVLSTSLAWPAWAGCDWAEPFSEPAPTFLLNPVRQRLLPRLSFPAPPERACRVVEEAVA